MHYPFEEHLKVVYKILRYVKINRVNGLLFKLTNERNAFIFTYVDRGGSVTYRRSTYGYYYTYVLGNLVTLRRNKHEVVARSSGNAKFRAITDVFV